MEVPGPSIMHIKSPASQMYACLYTSTIGVAKWLDFVLNLQNDLLSYSL